MLPKDLSCNERKIHNDREADELHDRDEDNYYIPHDRGIPESSKNHATQPTS